MPRPHPAEIRLRAVELARAGDAPIAENARAGARKVYRAVVLDAWSRRVVGWSIIDQQARRARR